MPTPTGAAERTLVAALSVGLVLGICVAFWPALAGAWLNWDDGINFVDNHGYRGLSPQHIAWAWTAFMIGVYQPVSWMLLGAQYVVSGMNPWGYHLTSILLHAAVAVVLLLVCIEAGARPRPQEEAPARRRRIILTSLGVALVMLHPMRVEVVAWVSCQPYLPCALFYLLALWAYMRAHPPQGAVRRGSLAATGLFFLGALLSKAPAVTLPAVLLLFDIWILQRLRGAWWTWLRPPGRGVLVEKVLFGLLAVPFALVAIAAKLDVPVRDVLEGPGIETLPAVLISTSLWFYPLKTLLPFGLSPFYVATPDGGLGLLRLLAPWLTLAVAGLMIWRPRSPATGLALAYLVTLAPNLGFVQITAQLAADRYGFIPTLVLMVMACAMPWRTRPAVPQGVEGTAAAMPERQARALPLPAMVAAGLAVAMALMGLTRDYSRVWRDSVTLWDHAARAGGYRSFTVLNALGQAYLLVGRNQEAIRTYTALLALDPSDAESHRNLGVALLVARRLPEAEQHLRRAMELDPRLKLTMRSLADVQLRQGRRNEALATYTAALAQDPTDQLVRDAMQRILDATPDLDPSVASPARRALGIPEPPGLLCSLAGLPCPTN